MSPLNPVDDCSCDAVSVFGLVWLQPSESSRNEAIKTNFEL
jgi:hypothetical protein